VSGEPLVSCIMPTGDRRVFAHQAIRYFLRQDYENAELIVVDDGYDAVNDLVHGDERIRYVRVERGTTLGEKRNIACEAARGELIAHWDDDDWIGPSRLRAQVEALRSTGALATAARELLHYRLTVGDAWLYRASPGAAAELAGATLLYRRSAWAGRRFPPVGLGEHRDLLATLPPRAVHAAPQPRFYMAVIHAANAAAANLDDPRWEPRPFADVDERLNGDAGFYVDLRSGRTPAGRDAGRPSTTVTVSSNFMVWDGYGSMAEYLAVGLARVGADVRVAPFSVDPRGLSEEFMRLLARGPADETGPVVWFAPPPGAHERFPKASDVFVNTMWEANRFPYGWVPAIQRTRGLIVPTRFVAEVARRQGVTVPIEVIPEGVDPEVYGFVDRPEREGVTTLMVGPLVRRKHFEEAVAGWRRAFDGDAAARLILKSKFGLRAIGVDDPRIEVADDTEDSRGILHWYREAHVLLALGNEGFGLPLVEGMATGLPVVALDSEGQSDVCADAGGLVLSVPPRRFEDCDDTEWGPAGARGVPDPNDVADRLHWVAGHRAEARELGREASRWALRHRNVWAKPPAVLDFVESRLHAPRPLRRAVTAHSRRRRGPSAERELQATS
jgi:hypothetical protein